MGLADHLRSLFRSQISFVLPHPASCSLVTHALVIDLSRPADTAAIVALLNDLFL